MADQPKVPEGRRFRFRVERAADGLWEVQDTDNDNKACFRTINEELARDQAAHLQPYVQGKRLK